MLRILIATTNLKHAAIEKLQALRGDASGVTAIEYGLIAGAIAVAIITTVVALGGDISNMFGRVSSALNTVGTSGGATN